MLSVSYNNEIVAVTVWHNMTKDDIEVSIVASNPVWREHIDELLSYPFKQLGLNRVTSRIKADNKRAIKAVEYVGFKHEGTVREALDGEDVLIYGMLNREWQKH